MAIGTPVQYAASYGASSTISPSSAIAAGSFVVLLVISNAGATIVATSVADNAGGNTWTVDKTFTSIGGATHSYISCHLATQLTTSTVITIGWSGSVGANGIARSLIAISGIAASSSFDTFAGALNSACPTLAQSSEIGLSLVSSNNGGLGAAGSGWTAMTSPLGGWFGSQYQIVSSTAGFATTVAGSNVSGTMVTYKGLVTTNVKSVDGLAKGSVKTCDGLAIASVKTVDSLARHTRRWAAQHERKAA